MAPGRGLVIPTPRLVTWPTGEQPAKVTGQARAATVPDTRRGASEPAQAAHVARSAPLRGTAHDRGGRPGRPAMAARSRRSVPVS